MDRQETDRYNDSEKKYGRLLLYGLAPGSSEALALDNICREQDLGFGLLGTSSLGQKIGELSAADDAGTDAAGNSLLLFDGVGDEAVRDILTRLREDKVTIRLKAVVTATNSAWTLGALLKELEAEHELMTAWHRLTRLVSRADLLMMEPKVLMDEGGFEQDVETAKQYLRNTSADNFTLEKLNEFFFLLQGHLNRLGY